MPTVITATEYLDIAAASPFAQVILNTPAWEVIDYGVLYEIGPLIGEDRVIPGVDGRLAVPREIDELKVSLYLNIYGASDQTGGAYGTKAIGLRTNIKYLRDHLAKAKVARTATLHMQQGGTMTATVYVDGFQVGSGAETGASVVRAVLQLAVPAGFFA